MNPSDYFEILAKRNGIKVSSPDIKSETPKSGSGTYMIHICSSIVLDCQPPHWYSENLGFSQCIGLEDNFKPYLVTKGIVNSFWLGGGAGINLNLPDYCVLSKIDQI